jgi:acyl-CoA thioester hydrolase
MFSLDFEVRDYECDIQGIVNNANYQNYLEHARHKFFHSKGVDFVALAEAGVFLVVTKAELEYKASLKPGDLFKIKVRCVRESQLKFVFHQEIIRQLDKKTCLIGEITGVAVNQKGKPIKVPVLDSFCD